MLTTRRAKTVISHQPELSVAISAVLYGFITSLIARHVYELTSPAGEVIATYSLPAIIASLLVVIVIVALFMAGRGVGKFAIRALKSYRIDVLALSGCGLFFGKLASEAANTAGFYPHPNLPITLTALTLLTAVIIPPVLDYLRRTYRSEPLRGELVDESEIQWEFEDELGSNSQAERFAAAIRGATAEAGFVFGIDGPWGSGKSSFVNLVCAHLQRHSKYFVTVKFQPLRYSNDPDLTYRIVSAATAAVCDAVYAPELRPSASRFLRRFRGKPSVSFFGVKLDLEQSEASLDEIRERLEAALESNRKRLVIFIDDLDRLEPTAIRSVLFAMRRTLPLRNTTYVVCYDSGALLHTLDGHYESRQFLEKFVSVKVNLTIDRARLISYLKKDWIGSSETRNRTPSARLLRVSWLLRCAATLLEGSDAVRYLTFFGDIRKIKRLANTLLTMQLDQVEFDKTDFNDIDLLHLTILYLWFPDVFRHVYACETDGLRGTFAISDNVSASLLKVPQRARESLDKVNNDDARFVLERVFDPSNRIQRSHLNEYERASLALVNTKANPNLEAYLKLIVQLAVPPHSETHSRYADIAKAVVTGSASLVSTIESIRGEGRDEGVTRLLDMIVASREQFSESTAERMIRAFVEALPRVPALMNYRGFGARGQAVISLARLLNDTGWTDKSGKRRKNVPENTVGVANLLLGRQGSGGSEAIIHEMGDPDRGVLGLVDLLVLRLTLSPDRGGMFTNVSTGLMKRAKPDFRLGATTDSLAITTMREISQEVFRIFRRDYIDRGTSIIAAIDALSRSELSGELTSSEQDQDDYKERESVDARKSEMKSFVLFQLAGRSDATGSGVCCGYFDESGDMDGHGISTKMREYLLRTCFNPSLDDGCTSFLDFCLNCLTRDLTEVEEKRFVFSFALLEQTLGMRNVEYIWRHYRDRLESVAKERSGRRVTTGDYVASYGVDLPGVFNELDKKFPQP